ncbi:MAG: MBL fold metallo-hydrolase [Prevotellaceae bacterium]|jgi:phosphoribosyl 1,2-cyclic phosphodiesterase|nr:MBL fold metallo-hydrolase [Prevotellaceae bacterium]
MKLKVLGSGSAGNCYILDNGKEALVIEAGVPFAEVKRALDFNVSRIAGCIVSHEHGDHAGHVKGYVGVNVYASQGTLDSVGLKRYTHHPLIRGYEVPVGAFRVLPFRVQHDAAEPLGFMICHEECGSVLFATDTCYLACTFAGLNNIIIECNYRLDILDRNTEAGLMPAAQRSRTLSSHMSYDTCRAALLANDLRAVSNIVLAHLSDGNSHAKEFKQGIRQATGKAVHIAAKGMCIEFNKTPF